MNTRPLVPALYDLFVAELARARQSGDDVASRRFVRELSQPSSRGRLRRAVVILDMVLGGEEGRADRLRQGLGYQPVPMPSDPVAALRTARSRLESELTRVDLNPLERRVLGRLRARLIEFGDDRATEAVEMLRNLPVYGEMLLSLRQR